MAQVICGSGYLLGLAGSLHRSRRASCSFPNHPEGIAALASFCREQGVELVALEVTGGSEKQPFALLWAQGLPVAVLNPRAVRRFAEGMGLLERASDRTMVGRLPARCLSAHRRRPTNVSYETAVVGNAKIASGNSVSAAHRGWMPTELPPPCGRGKVFSLDIPFYRTRQLSFAKADVQDYFRLTNLCFRANIRGRESPRDGHFDAYVAGSPNEPTEQMSACPSAGFVLGGDF